MDWGGTTKGGATGAGQCREDQLDYRGLFDTAKDGMVLISPVTGEIIEVNQSFLGLSGLARSEVLGSLFWEMRPLKNTDIGRVVLTELRAKDYISYDDLPFESGDGKIIPVEMTCSVHALGSGKFIQCTIRDITRRKSIEEALWRSESRFRTLFKEAAMGIAIVDVRGRIVEHNHQLETMLGYSDKEIIGKHFTAFSHHEDLAPDLLMHKELLARTCDSYRQALRCIRKDGDIVWGLLAVSLIRDRAGSPLYAIRIIEDITDRKHAEESIVKSRNFFLTLIDELPNPIRRTDANGKCDYFNKTWLNFTGKTMVQELGEGWIRGVHQEDRERLLKSFRGSFAARCPYTREYRLAAGNGEFRWVSEFGRPFNDIDGKFAGYISSCYDVHDRKNYEETLRSVSVTDDQTGLLNRRGFFALAERQLKILSRTKKGALLFYADLDRLKEINDTLGHPAGDAAIVETAAVLKKIFRESDIIARLGGDEFAALLLENTEIEDENVIMNRLHACIRTENEKPGRRYALSLSAGIVRYDPAHPCSLDEFISRADTLMYREKKAKHLSLNSRPDPLP
ncbi:MAG: PAS domain S-box protein [Nitrospiraceae bacterium]|nr:PAS domain S-box protein [Nitrospiraceae bacterium]